MRKLFTIIIMLAAVLTVNAQANKQASEQAKNRTTGKPRIEPLRKLRIKL